MRTSLLAGLAVIAIALGCGAEHGVVEVYWQFEDATLDRIYPLGYRTTTCSFLDRSGAKFDIRVQLTLAHYTDACAEDHTPSSCHVVEPQRFDCARARGTITDVPPSTADASAIDSDPGYLMIVEPVIVPADGEAFVPASTCIGRPGPRVRRVRPGRIADLEVHEFVVHALDPDALGDLARVDLDACQSGESDTGTDTGTDSTTDSTDTGTDSTT